MSANGRRADELTDDTAEVGIIVGRILRKEEVCGRMTASGMDADVMMRTECVQADDCEREGMMRPD